MQAKGLSRVDNAGRAHTAHEGARKLPHAGWEL